MICIRYLARECLSARKRILMNHNFRFSLTKQLTTKRVKPGPGISDNVMLFKLKKDNKLLFGLVGTLGTAFAVSGIIIVQQMINVHMEEESLKWRAVFVTVCAAGLFSLNLLAQRSAAVLEYNKQLNKIIVQKVGACGIRQSVKLTPKRGTVTFVENEGRLVIKHPDSRLNHYLNLKHGEVENEHLYEKLFAVINER